MLVYDVTNEKSFDNIRNWIRNIEEVCVLVHSAWNVELGLGFGFGLGLGFCVLIVKMPHFSGTCTMYKYTYSRLYGGYPVAHILVYGLSDITRESRRHLLCTIA